MEPFNFIFVPQGQEYRAVLKGLKLVESLNIQVVPIPMGSRYLTVYLEQWLNWAAINRQSLQVLVLGLCGSLSPHLRVGDVVVYQNCLSFLSRDSGEDLKPMTFPWDHDLALYLHQQLISSLLVRGLTTDRVITTATEKQKLSQLYPVEVVDMEGLILLEFFTKAGIKAAMVRVVSDDYSQNLPDLTSAISEDGTLKIFPFIKVLLHHPIPGLKLIRSGLKSLAILQKLPSKLQLLNQNKRLHN